MRPYYPVQGPFLPHSLYGPEVPLHPVWSNTALLVRQSIFRYLRITSARQMRALNDEFMSDLAHIRNQRFLRRILANSENTMVLPSTLRLFRSLRDCVYRARSLVDQGQHNTDEDENDDNDDDDTLSL